MNPPSFLRHITPWWLLSLIDKYSDYCWANMVMWKMFGDKSWKRESVCFGGKPEPYDWCGKFKTSVILLLACCGLMMAGSVYASTQTVVMHSDKWERVTSDPEKPVDFAPDHKTTVFKTVYSDPQEVKVEGKHEPKINNFKAKTVYYTKADPNWCHEFLPDFKENGDYIDDGSGFNLIDPDRTIRRVRRYYRAHCDEWDGPYAYNNSVYIATASTLRTRFSREAQ